MLAFEQSAIIFMSSIWNVGEAEAGCNVLDFDDEEDDDGKLIENSDDGCGSFDGFTADGFCWTGASADNNTDAECGTADDSADGWSAVDDSADGWSAVDDSADWCKAEAEFETCEWEPWLDNTVSLLALSETWICLYAAISEQKPNITLYNNLSYELTYKCHK